MESHRANRRLQSALVLASGVLLAASFVHPLYPRDQPLHHAPTVIALPVLFRWARRGTLGDASMIAINLFLWLHVLGARYIYSFVPYDAWCREWLGVSVSEALRLRRNHYDRLVHFAFGALASVPLREVFSRKLGASPRTALVLAFVCVLAISAVYEIFEWALAMVMAPGWADRYAGQQGDAWDAQKDMALAAGGALVACSAMLVRTAARKRSSS